MMKLVRTAAILTIAAFFAGCQGPCDKIDLGAPGLTSGNADFSSYVAVGTSISTGYQSGGVVDRHQINAFPAIFARQVGKTVQLDGQGTFSEPVIDGNGLPPLLQLRSLTPAVISNSGLTPGAPTNTTWPAPYSNLAVPGSIVFDFANNNRYGTGLFPVVTRGLGTIQHQLFLQQPTFVSFEFGANEVLGSATSGTAASGSPVATGAAFAAVYLPLAMQALHDTLPNAHIALFNVPDVRSIPFFTTWPPITIDVVNHTPSPLTAWVHAVTSLPSPGAPRDTIVQAPLTDQDLVLLTASTSLAQGNGFSATGYNYVNPAAPATGVPLDSALVLDVREQAVLASGITAMNTAVDQAAASAWVVKVDLNALLQQITSSGYDIGGTHYTTEFVTGGIFSLDGVHPTDMSHAIIANAMIDAVNAKFGSTVPHARVGDYATATSSAARPDVGGLGTATPTRIQGLDEAFRRLYPDRH